MELNLDKIKAYSVVTLVQLICGVIIPGFLFLFVFKRDLFESLDLFRLTTLAISVTSPILTINGIIILVFLNAGNNENQDEENFQRSFISTVYLGSILTIPVIYASIIIGYFFNLALRQGVLTLIISEVILLILLIIIFLADARSGKKATN